MPFILSQMLEAYRWIGALVVLCVHATNTFVSLADIMSAPHAPQVYVWWFFMSFELGHQLVLGFFVMSGYLVGGAVLANIAKGKDFLREYFIHRFARIYIVIVPALVLTFVADTIGRHLPVPVFYDVPLFRGHFGTDIFVANIFNLQEITSIFYGTNSPLWSLACEFWYYICFPLLVLPLARNYSAALRYGGFAIGLTIFLYFAFASPWFRFGFVIWVIGALASVPNRPLLASRWLALGLYFAVLVPIRLLVRGPLLSAHPWLQDVADIAGSVALANLMLTVRHSSERGWDLLRPHFHRTLADFSFSLYSIHMPLLILWRAAADSVMGPEWAKQLATPAHWGLLGVVVSSVVVTAYGFSRVTEARTGAVRRQLNEMLPRLSLARAA
jgi:peptidoglycan/LPS O-acetylase OafA/YrhL